MYERDMLGKKQPAPVLAIVIIVLLIVCVVVLVVLIGIRQPDSSTLVGSFEYEIATQELDSSGDTIIGINNATFYVAREAVTKAGSIVIYSQTPNLFSAADEITWSRPIVVNVEYRNEAGEPYPYISFSTPAEICFKLTRSHWEDFVNYPDNYQVQYYKVNEFISHWEALPIVSYSERSEVCGLTDHPSLFALAIKSQGSIPVTGITPTPPQDVYEP